MPDKQSKEDRDQIMRGEMLRSLVESDGWKVAKEMLDKDINVVKYVHTIDFTQPIEEIGKEAYARAVAINLIQKWFNNIQGEIDSYHEHLNQPENEEGEDEIIVEKSA